MHPVGAIHVLFFGIALPGLVLRAHRRMQGGKQPLPDRLVHFKSTSAQLVLFTLVSLLVAKAEWIDLFAFDAARLPLGLAAGAALYAAAVAYMRPRWRRAVERRAPIVHLFMPIDARERSWWLLVSVIAGIGEEITWRGVQTQLLAPLAGGYLAAAVLSAISFGLAHGVQGWRSSAVIAVFALGFQAVVFVSGGLYVAMLVHVAYDVTAGLAYGRLGRELGYAPATLPRRAPPR
jgi:membrane protease YdiL (CAAX protease family)